MTDIAITMEMRDTRHGRYVARVAGIDAEAELVFTRRGPELVSADHTGAPEALHGTGAAAALVDHLVAEARAKGFRIVPLCPYVQARYLRHPEWADVFTSKPGEKPRLRGS